MFGAPKTASGKGKSRTERHQKKEKIESDIEFYQALLVSSPSYTAERKTEFIKGDPLGHELVGFFKCALLS